MPEFELVYNHCPVLTPAGRDVILPNRKLLDLIESEWKNHGDHKSVHGPSKASRSQSSHPKISHMPMTQRVFAVLDRTDDDWHALRSRIFKHLSTDGICFFSRHPEDWFNEQMVQWGKLLDQLSDLWSVRWRKSYDLSLVKHPKETEEWFRNQIDEMGDYTLVSMEWLVNITASPIVSLALIKNVLNPEEAWQLSHLEVLYQTKRWGMEVELEKKLEQSRQEIKQCYQFYQASQAKR